eukprot:CAMPEP_0119333064 /NCGR_PEP_ID=MMETSP1333-20130426/84286_1 /TAXON_ID=418940 /ORGANISM="Scyphosphaera apsteinii, Strain RCC1455" /LENGTH=105 /DNA_ID=CAMNT_0007343017 /DNA_START=20 /DNA_END=334 /DNA_ORIENTATION=+
MNIPPERTGKMNESVVAVMKDAGKAINDTFGTSVVAATSISSPCVDNVVALTVPAGARFDYIVSMEDMVYGARFANYSIEYQLIGGSEWEILVPPCPPKGCTVKK